MEFDRSNLRCVLLENVLWRHDSLPPEGWTDDGFPKSLLEQARLNQI